MILGHLSLFFPFFWKTTGYDSWLSSLCSSRMMCSYPLTNPMVRLRLGSAGRTLCLRPNYKFVSNGQVLVPFFCVEAKCSVDYENPWGHICLPSSTLKSHNFNICPLVSTDPNSLKGIIGSPTDIRRLHSPCRQETATTVELSPSVFGVPNEFLESACSVIVLIGHG